MTRGAMNGNVVPRTRPGEKTQIGGLGNGKPLVQELFGNRENRRIGANGKSERGCGYHGEAAALKQYARSVSHILKQAFERRQPFLSMVAFPDRFRMPEFQRRLPANFRGRHAGADSLPFAESGARASLPEGAGRHAALSRN